ncbi:MAG: sporulation transcriptional regulator SpoIIID [Christensenellales bacterium]
MKDYIEERVLSIATYMLETRATVRDTAKVFSISKSTVHKDVAERLVRINPTLAKQTKRILESNKAVRHIRGGMATQRKYLAAKQGR